MTRERKFTNEEAERLDKHVGMDFWADWHSLDSLGRMQLKKKKEMDRALWLVDTRLSALSPYGTDYVEKIRLDLIEGFDLLLVKSQFPEPDQFTNLLALYEEAIESADLQLQEAESIPVIALITQAVSIKPGALTAKAKKLQKALWTLDQLVGQAMGMKIEAQIQQALGIVTNTIGLFLPGLSLLTKAALTTADLALDDALGPDKPGVKGTAGDVAKVLNLTMDAVQDVKKYGSTTKSVASKAGKILTVTGFYFDWDEVQQADKTLKAVQQALKDTKVLYNDLVKDLDKELERLKKLEREFKIRMEPLKRQIRDQRSIRDEMVRDLAYPITQPFRWKMTQHRRAS